MVSRTGNSMGSREHCEALGGTAIAREVRGAVGEELQPGGRHLISSAAVWVVRTSRCSKAIVQRPTYGSREIPRRQGITWLSSGAASPSRSRTAKALAVLLVHRFRSSGLQRGSYLSLA